MSGVFPNVRFHLATAARLFVAVALFAGMHGEMAFAKCGRSVSGSAWKYASTAQLVHWDGRWWVSDSFDSEMLNNSHPDPDSKPCSHCGGRPVDEHPNPIPAPVVRTDVQTIVFASQANLVEQNTPPLADLVLRSNVLESCTLEVAKRPPKGRLFFAVSPRALT